MSVKYLYKFIIPVMTSLSLTVWEADAAINIDRTRIIMNSSEKSLSVTLTNQSKTRPYLAQTWVEDSQGKRASVLLALPPLQRIDAMKKAQIRIMALPASETLPSDRETLFYFSAREIPPKSDKQNVVQIALQSRLKLFWRPDSIRKELSARTEEKLTIIREKEKLLLDNPTPYYITIGYLGADNKGNFPGFDSVMVAPFSRQSVSAVFSGEALSVGYIDDFGGLNINRYHCSGALCSLSGKAAE